MANLKSWEKEHVHHNVPKNKYSHLVDDTRCKTYHWNTVNEY